MFVKKKCYVKDEVLVKEKECEKEYYTHSHSIEPSCFTSGQGMDESQPSILQKLTSQGTIKNASLIEDICNSLRMLSCCMIHHEMIILDEQIIQLMSEEINWINKEHLIMEFKMLSPEDIGKIFAHVLIAVEDEQDILQKIQELCTDDIVYSLSAECKKLNFRYSITGYYYDFNSITVSFLIHLLSNAPRLCTLDLSYCEMKGVTVKKIVDTLQEEGVVLELRDLDISGNNLGDIEGSSLASLLAVASKLNHLDISKCSLSGVIMDDMVMECSSTRVVLELTHLDISGNNLNDIKGPSLATLLAVSPKLKYLYMSCCSLSGAIMTDVVKECSSRGVVLELTWLNICRNNLKDIKGSSCSTLLVLAPKLKYLNMSNCSLSGMDDMLKECSSRGIELFIS
ncbi:uncharacterized protein LOC117123233 [Anneissia japonica]|uniref:uncharacterized protein LOC117123233 n=1 Tax=Anneissia japonica TaxID=1529436 RepID=UPI0014258A56|nr:uncharacterized protein LOC117123233 [Anneissia japonica]